MCGQLSAQLLHVSAYRYTKAPTGDREVATVGKEKRDGFTVMVAHDAAGTMMRPFINTKAPAPNLCTSFSSRLGVHLMALNSTGEMVSTAFREVTGLRGTCAVWRRWTRGQRR